MKPNKKSYAGIGSRKTPAEILEIFTSIAAYAEQKNYILRSGHADGADKAFEAGVRFNLNKEIYIPWRSFSNDLNHFMVGGFQNYDRAFHIASLIHPNWGACSDAARLLHTRNTYQILGPDLESPVSFVACWTRGGTGAGGTGQAIRLARSLDIPVFDFGTYDYGSEPFMAMQQELKDIIDAR